MGQSDYGCEGVGGMRSCGHEGRGKFFVIPFRLNRFVIIVTFGKTLPRLLWVLILEQILKRMKNQRDPEKIEKLVGL